MKDYYRILQVHPEAEEAIIVAAYRQLIKKYHPDTLDPEKRDDPDILQIVRELNEAYEVLGDEKKRHQYDEAFKQYKRHQKSKFAAKTKIEKRLYLIRCGKTKRTFKMHLARPQGSNKPFSVLGFELLENVPQIVQTGAERKSIWNQIIGGFSKEGTKASSELTETDTVSTSLSDNEVQQLFAEAATLTMGDIDWNGHVCPDCGSVIENANGTLGTWVGCSTCGHIKCVGSVKKTRRGTYSLCPWCGKKNKVTRSVPVGAKDHLSLKGKWETSIFVNTPNDERLLENEKSRKLRNSNT